MNTMPFPLSLERHMREHLALCKAEGLPLDSDAATKRLMATMPTDAADYLRRVAVEDALRVAFRAVEAAGLGTWSRDDVFTIPPANRETARPIFTTAFEASLSKVFGEDPA